MSTTISIIAVGRIASRLLCLPSQVTQAAEQLGIAPTMTINGVPHYSESDVNSIGERVRELQRKRKT